MKYEEGVAGGSGAPEGIGGYYKFGKVPKAGMRGKMIELDPSLRVTEGPATCFSRERMGRQWWRRGREGKVRFELLHKLL